MSKPAMLIVHSFCQREHEKEFNKWYNNTHIHDVARVSGARNARRFQLITDGDEHEYLAMYEFDSEAKLEAFMQSEALKRLVQEYDKAVGAYARRVRTTYRQIYP